MFDDFDDDAGDVVCCGFLYGDAAANGLLLFSGGLMR